MLEKEIVIDLFKKLMVMNSMRYFLIAGPIFLLFYFLFKKKLQANRIQLNFPNLSDYQREIFYSIITIFIFSGVALMVFATPLREYNLMYSEISERGWGWWTVSIILMIILHDTYFYWAHRAMHHPALFKIFHLVHHKSTNPSPWASYSFHPLEGIVEAAVIFPIAFLIPFHPTALLSFLTFMMVYNVYGHLGYEILPKKFHLHPIGKWVNTSVNHNMHHKYFEGNYGLYFLYWDRWMGTLHPDYDKNYEMTDLKRTKVIANN